MSIANAVVTTRTTIERNIIFANYGAGLAVNNDNDTDSIITQNSFYDNGSITSRNGGGVTGQIGIDLNGTGLFAAGPEAPKR